MMVQSEKMTSERTRGRISRRQFVTAAGATLSFTMMKSELVAGTQVNSKITLGMVGCGSRATWMTPLFLDHGGYQLVAAADYFPDKVDAYGQKFGIDPARRYTGLSGYKRLLASKVDAVVIESPPYFHPEQAAAGVEADTHVYLAKPIAVDVPGCRSVADSGRRASAKKLCFLVDFQTRTDAFYREAVKRAQNGDIGQIICGDATYIAGLPWGRQLVDAPPALNESERRLRAWGFDRVLSGDVITEQNIHSIDVATWILEAQPLRAFGAGGVKARPAGDCWNHFAVIYMFPQDVILRFCSKQFGQGLDEISCRLYGTEGVILTDYLGEVAIRGKKPYAGGKEDNLYTRGTVSNIAWFYDCITKRDYENPTVPPSVRSNLTTILGRTAAYEHRELTWEEMMQANVKLEANLQNLKD